MVDAAGFTCVIHIGWFVVYVPRPRKASGGYGNAGRPSVSLSVRPTVRDML